MKVTFTTSGNGLEAPMDSRFGRTANFLIYDLDDETFEITSNTQSRNAAQGAGIQAAETVARMGVGALVTGHCGPKAFQVLQSAGIKIYLTDADTVAEALELYRTDRLGSVQLADVEGHWV